MIAADVVTVTDAVTVGLLALFVVWGMLRGPLRQLGSLLLLSAAFPLAARFGPPMEERVVRAVSGAGAPPAVLAWAVVFLGVLIVGGLGLALAQPLLRRKGARPGWGGALLGFVHGVLVLTVLGYGILLASSGPERPAWIGRFEASPTARGMRAVGRVVRAVAPLPPEVETALDRVDARVGG